MTHFRKLKPQLLKAFIKARVLEDASATHLDKMPKKGTIVEAEKGVQCNRTLKPVMIRWAYDVRQDAVKAKIPEYQAEHNTQQAGITQVQHLFTRPDDEGEGDYVDFLEDLQQDILFQKDAGIQDTAGEDSNDDSADLDSDDDETDDD
jgi:hypothetical protein